MLLSNKWRLVSRHVSTCFYPSSSEWLPLNTYQQPTSRDRTAGRSRHELARLVLSTRTLKLHPRVTTLQSNDVQRGVVRAQVARTLAKQAKHGETMFAVAVRAGHNGTGARECKKQNKGNSAGTVVPCPVSLYLSLSISLSIWMLSRSPVARVARHKSMLRHTEEAHTHERATCSEYWQHNAALWQSSFRRFDEGRPTRRSRCHALTYVALR